MSMLDDVAAVLATGGAGTVGTDIFKGNRPPTPDRCLTLFQYAGEPPEQITGVNIEYPGLQVWSRSTDPVDALTMLDTVIDILHATVEHTGTYARYLSFEERHSPAAMGLDDNGRTEYVTNFRVVMTRI